MGDTLHAPKRIALRALFRGALFHGVLGPALILVLGLAVPSSVRAEDDRARIDGPFDITANSVEYEKERDLYVARGEVRITQPDRILTADWVSFSNGTRQGVATGNVVVIEGGDTLYADVLHFEIDALKGVVFDGRLDARGSKFEMSGEEVRRTGEQTYTFKEASFTTCQCPEEGRQPWTIKAEEADLDLGGYGTARNTTFEVLGVPVLWLPWMIYPLKTDRQTGFLLPEFGVSNRSGTEVGVPFFWAVRPELNVILTPRYLSKRGFMPSAELEYVFGESAEGRFFGALIHDNEIDPSDPSTPFGRNRWAAEWIHDQPLEDWRLVADARFFSDNLYAFDFPEFSTTRSDRYLESKAFAETRFGPLGAYGFSAAVWGGDDLQNPDDQDRDAFLLQRLPQLKLAGATREVSPLPGWLKTSFDVDYTSFYSRRRAESEYPGATVVGDHLFLDVGIDAIPDGQERNASGIKVAGDASRDSLPGGPEGDGRFQEGEPLADRGQRVILNPRLSAPFRIADVLEVRPEVGYHGTLYQTRAQSLEGRHLFTGQLDVRARLRRSVELPFGVGSAVHLMEPRFAYTAVSHDSQSGNPLFVPGTAVPQERIRQLDLMNVTRDPADRVESLNALTAGVSNRFYVAGEEGESRLLADVSLSTQYNLTQDDLGNFFADGTVYPAAGVSSRFNLGWDLEEGRFSEALLNLGWSNQSGNDLGVNYRYLRDIPRFFESFRFDDERFDEFEDGFQRVNQLSLSGRLALTRNWALFYQGSYSFENSIFLTNMAGVEYISRCLCWAVRLEIADDRSRGVAFNLRYRLIGLGDDTVRPFMGR